MSYGFIQRGGIWVFGQFILLFAIVAVGIACRGGGKHPGMFFCGLALLAASGACGILGVIALGPNLTPFPKPRSRTHLVQNGIYAFMRHPLYTAVLGAAAGWSLTQQSWPALAASLVLAVLLDAKAWREEEWLCQEFPEYASYRKRVRKFLPCVY
ncbi:MAG TPA: isoprenylcysteine carboxylmethyltransferase family protein [Verrucomicrobiae bacterium]|nr:isoprenylcysteine carboxylmethyltransferase family protein [Verrucomicrobiae bacterium]